MLCTTRETRMGHKRKKNRIKQYKLFGQKKKSQERRRKKARKRKKMDSTSPEKQIPSRFTNLGLKDRRTLVLSCQYLQPRKSYLSRVLASAEHVLSGVFSLVHLSNQTSLAHHTGKFSEAVKQQNSVKHVVSKTKEVDNAIFLHYWQM